MIKVISHLNMGKSEKGWLHSTFHFSFAEYYNPQNINFGALRVVNDDLFDSNSGFDTHPHQDMEIISYVMNGVLTHKDSMGNKRELTRGQVQYMSAGTGVYHSEHNKGSEPLRFFQIWILPDKQGYAPQYGDYHYKWEDREGRWLCIASGTLGKSPVIINQDADISVLSLSAGQEQAYTLDPDRMAYLIQAEGVGSVNGEMLSEKDAAEIKDTNIFIAARNSSSYILFDLAK